MKILYIFIQFIVLNRLIIYRVESIDYENEIDLKLTLGAYGRGLSHTLLISASPSWLIINTTDLTNLSVVCGKQRWPIASQSEAVALPNFEVLV